MVEVQILLYEFGRKEKLKYYGYKSTFFFIIFNLLLFN